MPRPTRGESSYTIVHAARDLRRGMTPAEEVLWKALRGRRLHGLKFRRQHPLNRFILDFYCVERQLVVEVDGGVHAAPDQAARDEERTLWLSTQGIRVLRVTNEEVENDLAGVLRRIVEASSPNPLLPNRNSAIQEKGECDYSQAVTSPSPENDLLFSGEGGQGVRHGIFQRTVGSQSR